MSVSILSKYYECYVCRRQSQLHKHHIFEGNGRRELSEKYGCWVYLCGRHHNLSDAGVHFNKDFDMKLKQKCQKILEEDGMSRKEFISIFGRSYER